jgi:hypothetical protein
MKPLNDGRLCVAAPQVLCEAVARAAARNLEGVNTYVRQALLERLRKDGVQLEGSEAA